MILVTGATGFIGRSLMACFEREGIEARPYRDRLLTHLKLREQLAGVHTVIHLAGTEARGRSRLLQQVDIEGSESLLSECSRADIKHLVFVSRIGADPASMHPLLQAKGEIERMIKNSGLAYTILRSTSLYGRDDRFTEILLSLALWSWPFVWLPGRGEMAMQPLWVEDFIRCLLIVVKHPADFQGRTISVGGEERLRYHELITLLLTVSGKNRLAVPLPLPLLRPLSKLLFQWWYWPPVSQFLVDRFFVPEVTRTDAVLRSFGFRPGRLASQIIYLRRPGLYRRLFRR